MKRLFKSKAVRGSTTAGLAASTGVPDSGFTFVKNSQGASASIGELAKALDDVLNEIDFEGECSDFAKLELQRLDDEVSKYSNSRFVANENTPPWSCRAEDAPLLVASAKCSAAIYKPTDTTILANDTYRYHRLESIKPSRLGTVKATAFYEASKVASAGEESRELLVIAVRGSASRIDHMVNINNEAVEALEFNDSIDASIPRVHAGYRLGAKALEERVTRRLKECENGGGPKEIIFTGHSAGAAVASLLFQKFLSIASTEHPSLRLSCVTFGCPPFCDTTFGSMSDQARLKATNCRMHINFMNEFDIVPRLDGVYVLSLVNLYRRRFSLPPINIDGVLRDTSSRDAVWPLPAPVFVHSGDNVLLCLEEGPDGGHDFARLKANKVDSTTLGSLLFCRVTAHKVAVYLANIDELFSSSF